MYKRKNQQKAEQRVLETTNSSLLLQCRTALTVSDSACSKVATNTERSRWALKKKNLITSENIDNSTFKHRTLRRSKPDPTMRSSTEQCSCKNIIPMPAGTGELISKTRTPTHQQKDRYRHWETNHAAVASSCRSNQQNWTNSAKKCEATDTHLNSSGNASTRGEGDVDIERETPKRSNEDSFFITMAKKQQEFFAWARSKRSKDLPAGWLQIWRVDYPKARKKNK